jgi:catechol-2,3-dioxygenase
MYFERVYMETINNELFRYLDCIELYVPDLQQGIDYYCNRLGLKVLWKSDTLLALV